MRKKNAKVEPKSIIFNIFFEKLFLEKRFLWKICMYEKHMNHAVEYVSASIRRKGGSQKIYKHLKISHWKNIPKRCRTKIENKDEKYVKK